MTPETRHSFERWQTSFASWFFQFIFIYRSVFQKSLFYCIFIKEIICSNLEIKKKIWANFPEVWETQVQSLVCADFTAAGQLSPSTATTESNAQNLCSTGKVAAMRSLPSTAREQPSPQRPEKPCAQQRGPWAAKTNSIKIIKKKKTSEHATKLSKHESGAK